jgi:hypothetical protein
MVGTTISSFRTEPANYKLASGTFPTWAGRVPVYCSLVPTYCRKWGCHIALIYIRYLVKNHRRRVKNFTTVSSLRYVHCTVLYESTVPFWAIKLQLLSTRYGRSSIYRSKMFSCLWNIPVLVQVISDTGNDGLYVTEERVLFKWRNTIATSVADPDPGSGDFLTPGSGIQDPGCVKNQDPDPGMKNPDHISECLETIFWG